MDKINSKYFFEIDKTKPVYGLVSSANNKFYLLDNDYETLKLIQLLIAKHEYFGMNQFGTLCMIGNANCNEYGCDMITAGNPFDYDIYPLSIDPQVDGENFDFNLQENLFYIRNVIVNTKKIIENHINDVKFKDAENNTIMIKKFFNMLSTSDNDVKKIALFEEQLLNEYKLSEEKILDCVIDVLYSLDLKNLGAEQIQKELSHGLRKVLNKLGLMTRVRVADFVSVDMIDRIVD